MKYFFALILLVICTDVNAAVLWPASVTDRPYRIVADTDTTVLHKKSVSIGANYGSDVQFFGRTGPIKYPFLSTDAIYNFKSGVFVYGSAIHVLGYDPVIDEIDVGAGYLYRVTKKFTGSISYTRFIFNKETATVIRSSSSNDVDFKNAYDWKVAKSSLTFDYLFGDANDYFITLSTSKYIETDWRIFDDKDYFSFNPSINAIFGTQNFVGKFAENHQYQLELKNIFSPEDPDRKPGYNNGRFNALNYNIKIPVAYNRPHYTIEASWKYSIPVNVEGALKNRHEVFFNLTFYYLFF